ncbi:type II secretion system F family protein [Zoogloea sp.]|uniref:type II secretion system F family protein n=1 Tax=Zoogloea sp. TaxID=49181 RepID=UPI001416DF80|nr:MAG: type II secretion system F family protein [Zoogloea sp.]
MNDNLLIFALLLLFIAVFIAIEGVYIWWNSTRGPEATRIAKRLRMLSAGGQSDLDLPLLKRRLADESPLFERLMLLLPRLRLADRLLVQSGTDWSLPNYATYSGGLFLVTFFGLLLAGHPVFIALLAGLGAGLMPTFHLIRRRSRRLKSFEVLLPETLDLIGRALRAGHALSSALQMAGNELPDPVGEEFRQTFDEINFGISAQDALQNLARRVPSTDLGFFVVAVLIQRETGGNLSEILSNISAIIRARLKLFGKVAALSAEGRFSGVVLSILPFATGFLLYLIDSSFMSLLWTDPSGIFFLKLGMVFIVLGGFWMSRIVKIHV